MKSRSQILAVLDHEHLIAPEIADVITPFLFVTAARLIVGNLIIGLIEASLVSWLFGIRGRRLYAWIIAGNYFSALAGAFLLPITETSVGRIALGAIPMYHVARFHVFMYCFALLSSFVLEWPFFYRVFRGWTRRAGKSALACALAQVASYALLVPVYHVVFTQTLGTVTLEYSLKFAKNPDATVFFISYDGRSLLKLQLNGSAPTVIASIGPHDDWHNDLCICPQAPGSGVARYDLWLTDGRLIEPREGDRLLLSDITSQYPLPDPKILDEAIDLRPPAERDWEVSAITSGYAPRIGMKAFNRKTGKAIHLAVDTPFLTWQTRWATVLPGDQVILQIGPQIALLDLNTRQLAFVAFGQSPVVVLDARPFVRPTSQVSMDTVWSPAHSAERVLPMR